MGSNEMANVTRRELERLRGQVADAARDDRHPLSWHSENGALTPARVARWLQGQNWAPYHRASIAVVARAEQDRFARSGNPRPMCEELDTYVLAIAAAPLGHGATLNAVAELENLTSTRFLEQPRLAPGTLDYLRSLYFEACVFRIQLGAADGQPLRVAMAHGAYATCAPWCADEVSRDFGPRVDHFDFPHPPGINTSKITHPTVWRESLKTFVPHATADDLISRFRNSDQHSWPK